MKYSIKYIQISYNSMPVINKNSLPKVLQHQGVEGARKDAEALALVQHALNKHLEEIFPLEKRGLELLGALKFDKQDFADGILPLPYPDDDAACTWRDFCRMGEIQGYGSGSYPNCVLKFQDLSLPRCLRHESLDAAREDARALQALLDRAIVAWHLSEYTPLLSKGIALAHSLAEDKADIAEGLIPWPLALDDVAAPMWCSFLQDPELLMTTAGLKDATRALMKSIGLVPPCNAVCGRGATLLRCPEPGQGEGTCRALHCPCRCCSECVGTKLPDRRKRDVDGPRGLFPGTEDTGGRA